MQEANIRRQEEQVRAPRDDVEDAARRAARRAPPGGGRRDPRRPDARARAGAREDRRQHRAAPRRGARRARPGAERAPTAPAISWRGRPPRRGRSRSRAISSRCCGQQRELAAAELAELEVTAAKYVIHAPAVATTVQTQFLWPGELAQPGTRRARRARSRRQVRAGLRPGRRPRRASASATAVEIELDSAPGRRVPGEVTFVADQATFTPEKIESRSDRMGQVYRAKVRILAEVEHFQPGTEGNVYLIGRRATPPARPGRLAAMSVAPAIGLRLRGLVKHFGRRRALAGIDLEVGGAQIVGIIGPDGAGKTTLLRAIVGLLEIEAATATVLGYDLTAADVTPLKQHVGYVPQAFSLHRDLSVLENLRFTARLHRLSEAELDGPRDAAPRAHRPGAVRRSRRRRALGRHEAEARDRERAARRAEPARARRADRGRRRRRARRDLGHPRRAAGATR